MRAYQRAIANGTGLRLVVIADIVRRMLSLSGLDRLVSVYPALEAAGAGAERREVPVSWQPLRPPRAVPERARAGWAWGVALPGRAAARHRQ